ncbi:MAG: GTP 3',8-cyclase MoaA [Acidimicrobiales bacterium]
MSFVPPASGPSGPAELIDSFGRQVRDLRISVTDRCNFRCTYCMPAEGMNWLDRSELLSFEEMARVARVCVERFGFDGIRITGGEPTVRAQLPVLVAKLARLVTPATGVPVDLAMTTNGASLGLLAHDLRAAGLGRLNISCDSLRAERFAAITGRDQLSRVMDGIVAAQQAGFDNIKLNVVMMRGINDDEVLDFARFGRREGLQPRFIEFMPLDAQGQWSLDRVVPSAEIIAAIDSEYPLDAVEHGPEPAARYRYRDGGGEVGVVASVTEPFCGNCDRVRITAEGQFRTCLFALDEHDLRAVMRSGGDDADLAQAISAAVATKWAGHSIGKVNFVRPARSMSQIGG